ncbi:MAG: hypothetical protein PHS53_03465 [Candidatus Pacebacteria bacterium]|nr:hypothetical protein [Candidatus Paceibacterota bacterium]MDD5357175.1 hypothetical protein [Candidatus Paceibacterota bacterium]
MLTNTKFVVIYILVDTRISQCRIGEEVMINNFVPSPDWTDAERLQLIALLGQEMKEASQQVLLASSKVFTWGEKLVFLATQSPAFLEANRSQILGDD